MAVARQRADARRNHARILAVAQQEVAAHGAAASLEQIARVAGVGSATVRRHFPNRRALLEAVSRQRIEGLSTLAEELAGGSDSRAALLDWLAEIVTYCVDVRGLAAALAYGDVEPQSVHQNSCSAAMETAGAPLLDRAVREGAISGDVTVAELIALIVGITLATEHQADPARQAHRMFQLAVAGFAPDSRT